MKTAAFHTVRVTPELREAVERVLRPDETISDFLEESLRCQIAARTRGDARSSSRRHSAQSVLAEMKQRLASARSAGKNAAT
jgi:hypothetical protein